MGQIGWLFSKDKLRRKVWSHTDAYKKSGRVKIVAVSDIQNEVLQRFGKEENIDTLYLDYRDMLSTESLDIVSICVPTNLHYECVMNCVKLNSSLKAIFCEKPIASTTTEAKKMLQACKKKNIILIVNHIRHWDKTFTYPCKIIKDKSIGEFRSVICYYSDKVFNIGTHIFDLMRMYAGEADWVVGEMPNYELEITNYERQIMSSVGTSQCHNAAEGGDGWWSAECEIQIQNSKFKIQNSKSEMYLSDPCISGCLRFKNGVMGFLVSQGKKENLFFELDLIFSAGRIKILENGEKIEIYKFEKSSRYLDYNEMKLHKTIISEKRFKEDSFISAVLNIVASIEKRENYICSGYDAFRALEIAEALVKSAKNNGRKVKIG